MPIDILKSFVDRERELALFHKALSGETRKRVLLILDKGEQGKTCFLKRLIHECEQQQPPVPTVLLDFDERRSGLTDFIGIAREARRWLTDDRTPAICAVEEAIHRPTPLVNIQTGEGDAGIDWGKRGHFTDADFSDVAGRDAISVGLVSEGPPTADEVAKQRADLGRALLSDLTDYANSHARLVVLIDTFEYASEETCHWLNRWLFEPLRRELRHVVVVVAGRPQCMGFFQQAHVWGNLVLPVRFDPLSEEDIVRHFHLRGIPLDEAEKSVLIDLARSSPGRMALVGDWLEQERGGLR